MKYQGHKNWNHWNHWNVSLWIGNDEVLYQMAKDYVRRCRTLNEAAIAILHHLNVDAGITHTPDGAKYTKTSIRAAITDL